MTYLRELWLDLRMAWYDFRNWRRLTKDWKVELNRRRGDDVTKLREKGL